MINTTLVILKSHAFAEVIDITVTEDDRKTLYAHWYEDVNLLKRLCHLPFLEGCTTWDSLDRNQLQGLVSLHMMTLVGLSDASMAKAMKSLKIALTAFIMAIEDGLGRVTQVSLFHRGGFAIDFSISLEMNIVTEPIPKSAPIIKLVIVNPPSP